SFTASPLPPSEVVGTERGSLPDRGRILFPPSLQVCDWKEPQELRELLDLELRSSGELPERLLERCRDVIRYSVKTCHPRFFNQLFSGLDHHALAGRLIQPKALKPRQYGRREKGRGGSISNMYAMNVARFHRFPESRQKGSWALPRLALFTSQEVGRRAPPPPNLGTPSSPRSEPLLHPERSCVPGHRHRQRPPGGHR
uniref:Uncharacterized protein n=1 Tax=Aquila chrysaetos chrysaetos TaxID=223781 RepID=A0A663FIL0_AQUCH